ncbi:MAG: glutathione S-transferase N-terminal domain-containing protein [Proteobacteria bacterium]|nr:glutathione S-transferase N-terminal domain-containing protein [Burkholderiales bacterium]
MTLTLFYAPGACSLVPYVSLTEAGADFDIRNVNTGAKEQKTADYLAVNPKGKVPVLVIDGYPLTENVAIQQFIARSFPKANLLPADLLAQTKAISLMAWFSSTIHPHLTPNARPENYCDIVEAHDGVKRVAQKLLLEDLKIAEKLLEGREWFFDHFTVVDAYFFWCFRRATQFNLDLSAYPNCLAHMARMRTRPSVQKVEAYEKEVQADFARAA